MHDSLTPQQVTTTVDASPETIHAMVDAEKFGHAFAHGATISHAGYQFGAREFSAATSLFKVRY